MDNLPEDFKEDFMNGFKEDFRDDLEDDLRDGLEDGQIGNCENKINSEEYADFIVNFIGTDDEAKEKFGVSCFQRISSYYGSVFVPLNRLNELTGVKYSFNTIPALYGLMERDLPVRARDLARALEESGILRLQNQPVLSLKGQGCIMAFIDSGIDIFDQEFRFSNGDTRILRLWDMTDTSGRPPEGIKYGSEYMDEEINEVLRSGQGEEMLQDSAGKRILGRDELNHGNLLARIGAGNSGAVPEAYIVVVKLKPAKQYLRDYYFIKEDVTAYQENDIMLGVNYVRNVGIRLNMPVSLCMALGTNGRSHDGASSLSYILDRFVSSVGMVASVSVGDQGNKQLHASGIVGEGDTNIESYGKVEVRIDERQQGLVINIWGGLPGIISIGILSPTGEVIEPVEPRIGKSEIYNLILAGTTVRIDYDLVESDAGVQLIVVKFDKPTAGIWTIRIYGQGEKYNVYLPISQFVYENTYILEPDPNITIVDPAYAKGAITTSLYNAVSGALYIDNGRGFGRNGERKPDISTVLSTAVTAGAACQFLNWGIVEEKETSLKASEIKSYMIRGAGRDADLKYPNEQWGYGKLDVYNSFQVLKG